MFSCQDQRELHQFPFNVSGVLTADRVAPSVGCMPVAQLQKEGNNSVTLLGRVSVISSVQFPETMRTR